MPQYYEAPVSVVRRRGYTQTVTHCQVFEHQRPLVTAQGCKQVVCISNKHNTVYFGEDVNRRLL